VIIYQYDKGFDEVLKNLKKTRQVLILGVENKNFSTAFTKVYR
jgi:hypothetical protein